MSNQQHFLAKKPQGACVLEHNYMDRKNDKGSSKGMLSLSPAIMASLGMTHIKMEDGTTVVVNTTEVPLYITSDEIYDGVRFTEYVRVNTQTLAVHFVQEEMLNNKKGKRIKRKTVWFPMELTAVLDRQTGVKLNVKSQKAEVLDWLMKELPKCDFEHFYEGVDSEELGGSSSGDDKEEESDSSASTNVGEKRKASKVGGGGKNKNKKEKKYPFEVGDESECAYLMSIRETKEEFVLHGWDMEHPFYS
jgi:hypothetical protein